MNFVSVQVKTLIEIEANPKDEEDMIWLRDFKGPASSLQFFEASEFCSYIGKDNILANFRNFFQNF